MKRSLRTGISAAGLIIVFFAVLCWAGEKKEATPLTIKRISDTAAHVMLDNTVPVRGVQFTVEAVKMTEVRTTGRTSDFMSKFNEKNGTVLMVSTTAGVIDPGKGAIAEIICDKPGAAKLSGVRVVAVNVNDKNKPAGKKIIRKNVEKDKK